MTAASPAPALTTTSHSTKVTKSIPPKRTEAKPEAQSVRMKKFWEERREPKPAVITRRT